MEASEPDQSKAQEKHQRQNDHIAKHHSVSCETFAYNLDALKDPDRSHRPNDPQSSAHADEPIGGVQIKPGHDQHKHVQDCPRISDVMKEVVSSPQVGRELQRKLQREKDCDEDLHHPEQQSHVRLRRESARILAEHVHGHGHREADHKLKVPRVGDERFFLPQRFDSLRRHLQAVQDVLVRIPPPLALSGRVTVNHVPEVLWLGQNMPGKE